MSKEESAKTTEPEAKEPEELEEDLQGLTDEKEIERALGIVDEDEEDEANEEAKDKKDEPEEEESKEPESDEDEEEADEEPNKEDEEEKSEKESEEEKPAEPAVDPEKEALKQELEVAKQRAAESTKEYQTKYQPMEKQLTELQSQMEYTANVIAGNPELAAMFLRETENTDVKPPVVVPAVDEETKAEIEKLKEEISELKKETNAPKEKARVDAIMAFEKEHPGLTNDDRSLIGSTAAVLQEKLNLTDEESLKRAYTVVFPDKAKAAVTEKAEKEARVSQAKKEKATTQKGPAASGSNQVATLTADEKIVARKFGMTEDEYAAMKK